MAILWIAIPLILLLAVPDRECSKIPKFDEKTQAELDRLIEDAITHTKNHGPGRVQMEKYYKVRKFVMQRLPKTPEKVKSPVTPSPLDSLEPTTHRFFNKNWWFNLYGEKLGLPEGFRLFTKLHNLDP